MAGTAPLVRGVSLGRMHSTTTRRGLGPGWWLAGLVLAGCGGGGGGSAPPPVDAEPAAPVAGLRCSGPDGSGWCWQAPQPHGHWVNDVIFTSATEGWAVGDGGLVRHTRDGGTRWDEHQLPGAPLLQAVRFAPDGRQGWLLGADGGALWRSTDGGATWATASAAPLDFAASLQRADNGALIVRGDRGTRRFQSLAWTRSGRPWRSIQARGKRDTFTW